MTNSAYIPPSVSITEEVPVNVQPLLERPTSIAIVGETLGYLTYSETVFLDDINAVTLKQSGIDSSTVVVKSALDPSGTAYAPATDYTLSTPDSFGNRTLSRALYTTIPTGADLAVIITLGDATIVTSTGRFPGFDSTVDTDANGDPITNGADRLVTPFSDLTDATNPVSIHNTAQFNAISIQSFGKYTLTTDYTTAHASATSHTVTRVGSGVIISGQKVYVTYAVADGTIYENEEVTMSGTTAQHLAHESENVVTGSVIVTNSPLGVAASLSTAVIYAAGGTGDFLVSTLAADDLFVDRNLASAQGVNEIAWKNNSIAVKVTYNATPRDYYQPTRFFSQSDVEAKYGRALDDNGNINSPASFGAYMAFINAAADVVVQPLFHTPDDSNLAGTRTRTTPSSYASDWALAFKSLRDLEDVNVIVPVYAKTASSGSITDATVSTIFSALQAHIYYMSLQQQKVVAIYGEDSTIAGLATQQVLQTHARAVLGGSSIPECAAMVSPASFAFANPQSGTQVRIGGQYVAAAITGMLASNAVQTPLTRKPIQGITDVLDFRSSTDKDSDASSGLMVIEAVRGSGVRIRHSITTAVNNVNTRELSVVRAKNFMIESIKNTIDTQLIGQIIADANAPFTVSTTVQGVLEELVSSGAIVSFGALQSRTLPSDPTKIEVRFSYKPAYPLNYVSIVFSIDTTTGAIDTTQASNV